MMHWLDGTEPGQAGVAALAHRALALKAGSAPVRTVGKRLAAVFFNPSLRTRTSLESAAALLGIHPISVHPGTDAWAWELEPGAVMDGATAEHIDEAVGVLASYVDVLAVRSFARLTDAEEDRADPVLNGFVERSTVPVVNLESTRYHPLQGLADTTTWMERLGPDLKGRRLVLTWAPHPKALPAAVPNQVLLSAALQGMDVTVAHPAGFDLDPQILARASDLATVAGGQVQISHDRHARHGAEVIVAKSWSGFSGYGDRAAESERRAAAADWRVEADDLGSAGLMHCLPVRRNVVISDAALDHPNSWVKDEAEHRLWTAAAVLEAIVGGHAW